MALIGNAAQAVGEIVDETSALWPPIQQYTCTGTPDVTSRTMVRAWCAWCTRIAIS